MLDLGNYNNDLFNISISKKVKVYMFLGFSCFIINANILYITLKLTMTV